DKPRVGFIGAGSPLPKDTLYEERFPSDYFADLNPDFTKPAIFEGDIVNIVNMVSEIENNNRIVASSEPRTLLGIDFVGKEDVGYFLEEVRVNFLGLNLASVARLIENLTQQGTSMAGMMAAGQMGMIEQVGSYFNPTFFYSPWFYNSPFN
ncbi:MAG: hypothetical protein ACP5I1_11160, partial [Candidatus Hinthialibacter sp.]